MIEDSPPTRVPANIVPDGTIACPTNSRSDFGPFAAAGAASTAAAASVPITAASLVAMAPPCSIPRRPRSRPWRRSYRREG